MKLRASLLMATALTVISPLAASAEIKFNAVPFPATDAAKREIVTTDAVTLNGATGPLAYHTLARSGDVIGGVTFSQLTDQNGDAVVGESEYGSVDADFTSLLTIGDKLFSITHFESRPAAMYLSEVTQDAEGTLSYTSSKPIDFSSVGGLWVPCAGSVTPWMTHLGSEEYPADARAHFEAKELSDIDDYNYAMAAYFGVNPAEMTLEDFRGVYNPYQYGFPVEVTVTEVSKAMTDGHKGDLGGRNDVRLTENNCGAVYELPLDGNYVATAMRGVVAGIPTAYPVSSPYAGNACAIDGIANPDNITYITGQNTLLIGEDTGAGHQNDAAWAMDTQTGALTLIMTTPYGSELTSLDWYEDVNGHGYLMAVVQHPYGESDQDKAASPEDTRAYVGYVGPFPTTN